MNALTRLSKVFCRAALLALAASLQLASAAPDKPASAVTDLTWPELIPEQWRGKAVYTPPPADELDLEAGDLVGMQQPSFGVRTDLNGKRIRIPGFIVPLEFDAQHRVTRFFLVPYFGACIHFPPPPPNQTLHVVLDKGFVLQSIYDAYAVTGVIDIAAQSTKLGRSDYTLHATALDPYVP